MPKVHRVFSASVIVPVFNGRRFLRQAVLSLLNENLPELQIIVIDDGSSDGSADTISDLPVNLIQLKSNRGVAAARNVGLEVAEGKYITFLDADDLLCPGGIRWRLHWLEEKPCPALAGRPAGIIDEAGNLIGAFKHLLHEDYVAPTLLTFDFFKNGGAFPFPLWNYIFHRDLLREVGLFDEKLKLVEDAHYLMRILQHTDIPVVFLPLVYRRLHDTNLSVRKAEGRYTLRDETIQVATKISSEWGIIPTQWNLWETGYTKAN